jgi:signal-transduction protein with cAMP-binding, CBS, and nucleotidyltransferase domain
MTDISTNIERKVALVDSNQTVLDAARVMADRFIGSVVVTASSDVKGIFTERDLMRVVAQQQDPSKVQLKDVMRADPVSVGAHETVDRCLQLMKENKCRHLLVFESGKLAGIVSLRDLAAIMLKEKEALISQLTKYITG